MGRKQKLVDELTSYQECCVCIRKTSRNFQRVTQFHRKKQRFENEYLTIFDILENLQLLNYEITNVEETIICNPCKKAVLDFFDFKVMTENKQEESKSIVKSVNYNAESIKKYLSSDHYDTLKNYIVKNSIKSIEENDQNELTIRALKIKTEVDIFPEIDFSANEVIVKIEKSDDVQLAFCDNDDLMSESSETNEIEKNEQSDEEQPIEEDGFNLDLNDEKDGVSKTVVDNVEFISRVPECLVNLEKKKKEQELAEKRRIQNPEEWRRIKQRQARVRGQSYISKKGKHVRARKLQEPCTFSCRFKCLERISDFDRRKNFENHWNLGDFALQKKFLFEHRKTEPVARRRGRYENPRPRAYSTKYYLDTFNADGSFKSQEKVCETMFCSTFDICKNNLRTLYKKVITGKVQDMRGQAPRKLSPGHLIAIDHVKRFPYFHIEQKMTVTQIYKLYVQECVEKGIEVVREATYRKIFSDYNECDFLKQDRRKFLCEICSQYEKANDEEKASMKLKFDIHISNNDQCKQRLRWRKNCKVKAERRKLLREQKRHEMEREKNKIEVVNQQVIENYGTEMEFL